ncbi:MAG TPA: putative metal-binding motif-containing protein, partial [Myxococcota bacterium]|nr:putative metal-binding motif-containing protein [Myxococcota bacterium]
VEDGSDCDDLLADIHPGAEERCDEVDQDCDGTIDEEATDAPGWTLDDDGDGYGGTTVYACSMPANAVTDTTDCDDSDSAIFPGSHTTEVPDDGVDPDCDGQDRCTDLSCDAWPDLAFASPGDAPEDDSPWLKGFGDSFIVSGLFRLSGSRAVAMGDVDQDGYQDLIYAAETDGSSTLVYSELFYGGVAGPGATSLPLRTEGATDVKIFDADGDGWLDFVFAQSFADDGRPLPAVLWWNRQGVLGGTQDLDAYGMSAALAEDFDGDAQKDLAFVGAAGSAVLWGPDFSDRLELDPADGFCWHDRQLVLVGTTVQGYDLSARQARKADVWPQTGGEGCLSAELDGDSLPELLLIGDQSTLYMGQGGSSSLTTPGARSGIARDLDLDGHLELILPSHSGSAWLLTGQGSFSLGTLPAVGAWGVDG